VPFKTLKIRSNNIFCVFDAFWNKCYNDFTFQVLNDTN